MPETSTCMPAIQPSREPSNRDDSVDRRLRHAREVLCEPTRSQIIRALSRGALTVGQLAEAVGRRKWATSQHLRVLRENGFVEVERQGRQAFYRRASGPDVERVVRAIEVLVGGSD